MLEYGFVHICTYKHTVLMNYIAWFDVILQTVSSIYQLHSCELKAQVHST